MQCLRFLWLILIAVFPFSYFTRYQIIALQLLSPSKVNGQSRNAYFHSHNAQRDRVKLHVPRGLDLMDNTNDASQAALWGIKVSLNVQ